MPEAQSKTTEQSIFEAAETLFLDKGYAKTSTTEIARQAGCNQALVHYYFRSKENLFIRIFEKKAQMFVSPLIEISDEDLPFEEKLKKRISVHFDMVKANRKLPVLLFNEVSTNADIAQKIVENVGYLPMSFVAHMQAELDAEYEQRRICKTDAKTLLFSIFSMNVMSIMSAPVFRLFVNTSDEKFDRLLEKRKVENIKFIMKSLRP